jgi:hypothetical protein
MSSRRITCRILVFSVALILVSPFIAVGAEQGTP